MEGTIIFRADKVPHNNPDNIGEKEQNADLLSISSSQFQAQLQRYSA